MNKRKILSLCIALIIWYAIGELGIVKPIFLPSLQNVLSALKELIFSLGGIKNIAFTLKRTLISFIIGAAISIPLGAALGSFKEIYESFEWFIDFFRSVPAAALFPLFLIFFGFGDPAKIAMGAWASGFVILVNTIHGVWSLNKNRKLMAQTKKATPYQILTKITLYESLPYIFAGMRIGISWNLIVVIVAEMFIGTRYGLGHYVYNASVMLDTPSVIAGIIIIGLIGLLINNLLVTLENKIVHWKGH